VHDDAATVIVLVELAARDVPWTTPHDLSQNDVLIGKGVYDDWDGVRLYGMLDGRVRRLSRLPSKGDIQADDWRILVDAMGQMRRLNGPPTSLKDLWSCGAGRQVVQ
jgi:hypothetical protein